jgi:hypothetical protein
MSEKRVVFISATYLYKEYKKIDQEIIENSIFFFGSKKSWIFPQNEKETKESKKQPTNYLNFEKSFLDLILSKEEKGMVYFLKPDQNYEKVSEFFQTLKDLNGDHYPPLNLNKIWWKEEYNISTSKFGVSSFCYF